jgi:DNA-directed RNA polymerase specialized sigma24 family protein
MPQVLQTLAPTAAPPRLGEELDDATLVAEAKRDRQAFAPLYRRYVDRVYRYCDRVLGDRELAEDATSLVFTKALAGLPRCRDDAFRSWLFAIAHNVVVDIQRARVSTSPLTEAVEIADGALDRAPEAPALVRDDAHDPGSARAAFL